MRTNKHNLVGREGARAVIRYSMFGIQAKFSRLPFPSPGMQLSFHRVGTSHAAKKQSGSS